MKYKRMMLAIFLTAIAVVLTTCSTPAYDWQAFEIETDMVSEGWKRVMLIRRSKTEPDDLRAHICYAPENTPNEKLIEIAGTRWTVKMCFKESKGNENTYHSGVIYE